MSISVIYTNGVIAANEKYLLKDKLARFVDLSAEDAFRLLVESGFGGGAIAESVYEYEKLVEAEEGRIDAFIKEYAPSETEKEYLLSARDFHNAKALLKAKKLGVSSEKLLAPTGLIELETLVACVENADYAPLYKELKEACEKVEELFTKEEVSGAVVGEIFEVAYYARLLKSCRYNKTLKKIVVAKIDMLNLLAAFRAGDEELFKRKFVSGGKLKLEQISLIFAGEEKAWAFFKGTDYAEFYKLCSGAKQAALPLTAAENKFESYETDFLAKNKYELERSQPFLYYVFRRRAECSNVRIVFVCLLAGLNGYEIEKRLRAIG